MRIAIDCRPVGGTGAGDMAGIGRYAFELVRHLLALDDENRYALFFDDRVDAVRVSEMLGSSQNARAKVLPLCRYKKLLPYAYAHHVVAGAIAKERVDVYHSTSGSLPMGYRRPSVITVHDLAIYLHPEWFPGKQLFSRRIVVPASVGRARKVVVPSQATKRDLQRLFAVPSEKIAVIHEGVARHGQTSEPPFGLKHPYFLFLGTIEPRKNVDGLVRAYAALAERFPKLVGRTELVVAGAKGWKWERAFAEAEAANRKFGSSGPKVRLVGYVDDADKDALMANALAFVFPTWYEGFGLPVLEAMSLGVPVVSSNVSSIPEVVGRAGLLIDPGREPELVLAMKHLLEDPAKRQELGRRAIERSTEFRWEKTAGETLEVYEEAARNA